MLMLKISLRAMIGHVLSATQRLFNGKDPIKHGSPLNLNQIEETFVLETNSALDDNYDIY